MTLSLNTPLGWQEFDRVNALTYVDPKVLEADLDGTARRLQTHLWAGVDRLRWYDAYYEGEQPLQYMSAAMAAEVKGILSAVVLNWCRLGADMYAARMRVDGFRFAGDENTDADLWRTWQANGLDRLFQQAVLESLILGRSYMIVGSPDQPGDEPVITVESPFQVTAVRDPRTRKVREAVKMWQDITGQAFATLYEPNRTTALRSDGSKWVLDGPNAVDDHNLGMVPVVPLVNRGRLLRPNGVSEFHDVIPIVDAAIKAATDMMVSAEYHAMPRRWVFGMKKGDFKDASGSPVSMWSAVAGRIWSHENENIKAGQFTESDLSNFHNTIKLLGRLVAQILASPEALSFDTVNPPSAEALGAQNAERDMRIRVKQTDLGEAAEDAMRLVLRFKSGEFDPRARSLETVWADPSTMTFAQKADGTVKLVTAKDGQGRSIITVEQAREDLGYGAIARQRMAEQDVAAQTATLNALRDIGSQAPQIVPDDTGV